MLDTTEGSMFAPARKGSDTVTPADEAAQSGGVPSAAR